MTVARERTRLEHLYAAHAPAAARLAFLLTGDRHAAEDLVHDAFVRLAARFQTLRSPDAHGRKASGRLQAESPEGIIGTHSFEAERRETTVKTGTGTVASNELFGNEFGPGEKIGLASDSWRDGYYTFLLRRYLDKTCLHFEGSSRCATTEHLGDGFQLVLVAGKRAEGFFGGLVGDDVETIEFRIGSESYHVPVEELETGAAPRVRYFTTGEAPVSWASPGRLVAYGSDDEIVDSMWVGRRP